MADSSQMAGLGSGGEVGTARQVRAPGRLLPGLRDVALQRRGQHPWVPAASPIVAQALRDLAPTDPSSLKSPLRRPSSGGSNSVRQLGAGPSSPLGRPDAAHRVPPCVPLTGGCSRPFARTVGTRSLRFTSAHASCRPGHPSACSVLPAISGRGREKEMMTYTQLRAPGPHCVAPGEGDLGPVCITGIWKR